MASANFYTLTKRKNSTLQPSGTGDTVNVVLKSGTSLLSPTLLLNKNTRPTWNYFSFEGRYYFITDVVSVRQDLWEISGNVDALASWKSAIGSSSAMIMYASGGSSAIIDQRIPVKNDLYVADELASISGDFTGFTDSTMGIPIISITGVGSFGNYLLQYSGNITKLMKNLDLWASIDMTDVLTAIKQLATGGNAGNNLKNAICLPIILSSFSNFGPLAQLYLGRYPCTDESNNPINGYPVVNPFLKATSTVSIPWRFSDWRRNVPYTKVYLYVPIVGMISIASSEIINESSFLILYSINIISGDISVEIKGNTSGRIIATASGNIAMSTPYGSANVSGAKITTVFASGVAAVAGIATGNMAAVGKAISIGGTVAASAAGIVSALGGETSGGGGLGGSAVTGLDLGVHCYTVSKELTDSQANLDPIMGKPVMAKHTINTYGGFVQTDGMCVNGAMTESEYDMINSACDRGIYYE